MPSTKHRRVPKRIYRLDPDALWGAAARLNDTTQADIARRTDLGEPAVSRLMNGRYLSLNALMTLSRTYHVAANALVLDDDDQTDRAEAA